MAARGGMRPRACLRLVALLSLCALRVAADTCTNDVATYQSNTRFTAVWNAYFEVPPRGSGRLWAALIAPRLQNVTFLEDGETFATDPFNDGELRHACDVAGGCFCEGGGPVTLAWSTSDGYTLTPRRSEGTLVREWRACGDCGLPGSHVYGVWCDAESMFPGGVLQGGGGSDVGRCRPSVLDLHRV